MIVRFAPWRPDSTEIGDDSTVAKGVVPHLDIKRVLKYRPFPSFAVLLNSALGARCQGAAAFLDSEDETHAFAGTGAKLYKEAASSWTDVSKSGDYTIGETSTWKFVQVRTEAADRIIAFGDNNTNIQSYTLNSSTDFDDLSSDAPRAKCGAVMDGNILMVGNTWDSVGGYASNRVWWHGRDATDVPLPTSWPTPGSAQAQQERSDYRDLDTNGAITAMVGPVGGGVGGLVFAQKSIHRVVKDPTIGYAFYKITNDVGCIAGGSVVRVEGRVFFLSDRGWYETDGNIVRPIGAGKVDSWTFDHLDEGNLHAVWGVSLPRQKLVVWAFGSASMSGISDYLLAYNYDCQEFSLIGDSFSIECLFLAQSLGYTLEQLDDLYDTLEDIPGSLDDATLKGGAIFLGAFNSDHKLGAFNSTNLAARIETSELVQEGNRRFRSTGVRPLIEATGTLSSGDVTVSIGYRDTPNGTVTYDTGTSIAANGICPQLRSAKFQRARFDIAAGVDWKQATGAEYEFTLEGRF
jgi:hypothetical protein